MENLRIAFEVARQARVQIIYRGKTNFYNSRGDLINLEKNRLIPNSSRYRMEVFRRAQIEAQKIEDFYMALAT